MVRPLGVTGAVVVEASGWLEDNQWVLDLAKDNPVIVGLVGHLEPGADGFRRSLTRFARNPLFRGIRLNGGAITVGIPRRASRRPRAAADAGDARYGNATMVAAHQFDRQDSKPGSPSTTYGRALRRVRGRRCVNWRNGRRFIASPGVLKRVNGRVVEDAGAYRGARRAVGDVRRGPVMYSNWPVSDRLAAYPVVSGGAGYVRTMGRLQRRSFCHKLRDCYRWIDVADASSRSGVRFRVIA
jgi:hypothetical protein